MNDGLRFANPSYELIRLTALRIDPSYGVYRVYELIRLTALRKVIRRTAVNRRRRLKQQNAPHEGEAFSLQRRIQ